MMRGSFLALALLMLLTGSPLAAQEMEEIGDGLPVYEVQLKVDPATRGIQGKMLVTWTNTTLNQTSDIVFNAHARYTIPDGDIGLLAKTVEILRLAPSESLSFDGPALEVRRVQQLTPPYDPHAKDKDKKKPALLVSRGDSHAIVRKDRNFTYAPENPTALIVSLPTPVLPGDRVTLELDVEYKLAPKKGRWGQWGGVTVLAQGLPTVAVYDDKGWQPAPFIPWHQPFHNEAGYYLTRITLPADQKLACSAVVPKIIDHKDGWVTHECAPILSRDFSFMCSARYQEHRGEADGVAIRVLALPEHEHYGKLLVKYVSESLPVYNRWFGKYPYPQFTVAEAYFGWNGNECGGLVMIDSRMMGMPKMAHAYLDSLVSHELCHQWFYNVVGTNGYAETWMDEGVVTYFTHRLMDQKYGKENNLLEYPKGLGWLPNIRREDFRSFGYLAAAKRGDAMPTVQDMPDYKHLMNLSAMTYDRGSKVVGLIEQRLGPDGMLDFMRCIYRKYQFRILRVADFKRELEEYTREPWDEFFQHWVYGKGQCDWKLEDVDFHRDCRPLLELLHRSKRGQEPVRMTVYLKQQGEFNENTVLGIRLAGDDGFSVRIPIIPSAPVMHLEELGATVHCSPLPLKEGCVGCRVRVELTLPCRPRQITVDPDRVLLDECPDNNAWKREIRLRVAPLYTQLEEADVTNPHDRPSVIFGPWIYGSAYADPWFAKSPLVGFKAGVYRTQEFSGGAFVAYRTNDRNFVFGAEAMVDHFPFPETQVGVFFERQLATFEGDDPENSRGVIYGRHILTRGSSLYLPPFEYWEGFAAYQNRSLPNPRNTVPGADPFNERASVGLHYHKYFLTPYWDPEGGAALDMTYQLGVPAFGTQQCFHQVFGQVSWVKSTPRMEWLGDGPLQNWVRDTRWAFRLAGAGAVPFKGQFFTQGGADYFRGFDLSERQGSVVWVGSVEWRIPVFKDACIDICDNVAGVQGLYVAPFYDVGDTMVNERTLGPVAHAFGVGLRMDVMWLGLIERTMFRLDVAKTINADTPWQVWFGVMHPF